MSNDENYPYTKIGIYGGFWTTNRLFSIAKKDKQRGRFRPSLKESKREKLKTHSGRSSVVAVVPPSRNLAGKLILASRPLTNEKRGACDTLLASNTPVSISRNAKETRRPARRVCSRRDQEHE